MKNNKRLNYRVNNFVTLIIVFVIFILLNLVSNVRFIHEDISETMMNSLSDSTEKVLARIDSPIDIYAFYKNTNPSYPAIVKKLEEFRIRNRNIRVFFADVDKDPEKAISLGVKSEMLVITDGEKREDVHIPSEERITGALNRIVQQKSIKIYFLKGHGEKKTDTFEKDSISTIVTGLKRLDFQVQDLYLTENEKVPEDCDVLVICGPEKPLLEEEEKKLQDYLDNSGKIFLSLDTELEGGNNWSSFLYYAGIEVYDGIVADFGSNLSRDVRIPVVKNYRKHFITDNLAQTFYPFALGLREAKEKIGGEFYIEELAKSDPNKSYIETGESDPEKIEFERNEDIKVSAALVIASKKTHKIDEQGNIIPIDGRIVVTGDSTFITDAFVDKLANGDLFLNSINWLAEDKDILAINLTDFSRIRRVELTNMAQVKIFWISVVIIPLLIALSGILIVYRREHE